jgi:tRNA(Ile)-lysidine synthetase-like protein
MELRREYDRILLGRAAPTPPPGGLRVDESPGEGRLSVGDRPIAVCWRPLSGGFPHPDRIAVAVPAGHYPLMFRGWRAGDRIRLAGGTRKLKKLFGDRRVPVSERRRRPVLADRKGNVLWIEGLATAVTDHAPGGRASYLEFELRHE